MNQIYNESYRDFYDKGYVVLPLDGKNPNINGKNWQQRTYELKQKSGNGIGLMTGEKSGVICIDIDTKLKEHQQKLYSMLPPLFSGKIGNKEKGNNYFFRFNGEINRKIKLGTETVVELLSTGNQTVLPPSVHPEKGYPYEWLGFPLTSVDPDDLPFLPDDFIDMAENYFQSLFVDPASINLNKKISRAEGRCAHGSHNQLSSMLSAAIMAGDTIETIVKNLLTYDSKINPEISYFLCPERREFKSKDREFNCQKFVREGFDRHIRNGKIKEIPKEDVTFIVDIKPPKKIRLTKEKTYLKLPKLPGIGKEIFNDLYENSPIPRTQLCFMNTLNVVSMLIGNTVNLSGTYANLYLFGIAPSGFGKDFSFKRSIDYFDKCGLEKKLGSASPTSESQVLSLLEKRSTEQCMFVNEGESLLKRISSDRTNNGLRECLTDLYDMPGKSYVGKWLMNTNGKEFKAESIGKVYSPYVNMVILMTQRAFKDHVSMGFFETGLLSRPLFFFEDRFKRQKNLTRYNPPIPTDLTTRMINFHNLGRKHIPEIIFSADAHFNALELQYEPDALDYLAKLHEAIEDQRELLIDDPFFGMLSRQLYLINKISLNHHAMLNECDYTSKKVSLDSVKWSNEAVKSIMHNQRQFLCDQINSPYGALRTDIEKFISSKDGVTISDIHQKFRQHQLAIRKAVVQDLKESSVIMSLNNKIYRA